MWHRRGPRAALVLAFGLAAGGAAAQQPPAPPSPSAPGAGADAEDVARCAIERRRAVLLAAGGFRYAAFTKLVVRDADLSPDSARSVLLLGETRSSVYARHPGDWQETVLARRRWGESGPGGTVVGIRDVAARFCRP